MVGAFGVSCCPLPGETWKIAELVITTYLHRHTCWRNEKSLQHGTRRYTSSRGPNSLIRSMGNGMATWTDRARSCWNWKGASGKDAFMCPGPCSYVLTSLSNSQRLTFCFNKCWVSRSSFQTPVPGIFFYFALPLLNSCLHRWRTLQYQKMPEDRSNPNNCGERKCLFAI